MDFSARLLIVLCIACLLSVVMNPHLHNNRLNVVSVLLFIAASFVFLFGF